jgi:acetyltransferase
MSTYRLAQLFAPRSIAVVGGGPRDTSPGRAALKNLRSGGFAGAVHLVNPHYESIEGIAVPATPDVAVIAVPPIAVAPVVRVAAAKGTAAAIILTAGLGHGTGSIAGECEQAARAAGMRIVGPNCRDAAAVKRKASEVMRSEIRKGHGQKRDGNMEFQ